MAGQRLRVLGEVCVLESAAGVARQATSRIAAVLRRALIDQETASLVLSGGSTPLETYRLLAGENLRWRDIHLYWGDERCVAPGDSASNHLQARAALIDPAGIPEESVHRIRGELGPGAAAADYERRLRSRFSAARPVFDLAILGVGLDGHTASLFPPASPELSSRAWVVSTRSPQPPVDRVSLSYEALRGARQVMFLVVGRSKAAILERVLKGLDQRLPAACVAGTARSTSWLLDRPAASDLT